jgi:hypothetical protein
VSPAPPLCQGKTLKGYQDAEGTVSLRCNRCVNFPCPSDSGRDNLTTHNSLPP